MSKHKDSRPPPEDIRGASGAETCSMYPTWSTFQGRNALHVPHREHCAGRKTPPCTPHGAPNCLFTSFLNSSVFLALPLFYGHSALIFQKRLFFTTFFRNFAAKFARTLSSNFETHPLAATTLISENEKDSFASSPRLVASRFWPVNVERQVPAIHRPV